MNPSEFCYWLQGWTELEGGKKPNMEQWISIKAHLGLVFTKVTPDLESPPSDLETLLNESDLTSFEEVFPSVEMPALKDLGLYDEKDLQERLPEEETPIGSGNIMETKSEVPPLFVPPTRDGRPTNMDQLEKICAAEPDDKPIFCATTTDRLGRTFPRKIRDDK